MSHDNSASLKKLPLHEEHERFGGRFGAFGEWYVPLYFTSVIEEHEHARNKVGVFDISHMGEFYVRGQGAKALVNEWITNDVHKLFPGRALYSPVCRENGGIVDDVVVMEEDPQNILIIVNAANIEKDFSWFSQHLKRDVKLENWSDRIGLLAIQGPLSRSVIKDLFEIDLGTLSYYHFVKFKSSYGDLILSETGYTGEEGFEIFCPTNQLLPLWKRLFEVGKAYDLRPIGFGARDTLRLESKYLLYGHDMSDQTNPVEAGLGWTIGWNKDFFIGKDVLVKERTEGPKRKLVGFEILTRAIARENAPIFSNGKQIGQVTSGTFSPTLKKSIGLAYVSSESAQIGEEIDIQIRDKQHKAQIVKTPFYKRSKEATKH